ncbi:ABC-type transport auxiliary lipoprotein family protein [Antarctobacter jejuensis]|uniref:ABC-type transport auxiliary lipoprotein family protein n=1 Tax=Antarctobacter jejuensis TaxID=1439938 RepID=UPI003FD53D55
MKFLAALRLSAIGMGLVILAGCSAISSLDSAAKPLETYELSPLPAGSNHIRKGRRLLEVAMPTATGALTSDRIVIKPTPLQVQTLQDARWIDEAADHVQLLLVRSLANSGKFALVAGAGSGPSPDYVLMTDLQAFQAEITDEKVTVEIRSSMTLLSDSDGTVVSSRSFSNTVGAADTSSEQVIAAFDVAMTQQLTDVVDWLVGVPGL